VFLAEQEGLLRKGTEPIGTDLSNANANIYGAECVAWHTDAIA